jgi:hypothetical protein
MVLISSRSLATLGLFLTFATRLSARTSLLTFTTFRRPAIKFTTFLYFLVSCGACFFTQAIASERVPFVTIDQGSRSGVRERKSLVIKTETDWKALWRSHVQSNVPAKELPRVDFEKEMIVAVFLGEKPSGGYSVEITRIEENPDQRQTNVFWRESKPPPGSMVIQALTQPYHVVRLKTVSYPVVFIPMFFTSLRGGSFL